MQVFLLFLQNISFLTGYYFFVAKTAYICYNDTVMEKKTRFYVSPKNWLTWLVALCMV